MNHEWEQFYAIDSKEKKYEPLEFGAVLVVFSGRWKYRVAHFIRKHLKLELCQRGREIVQEIAFGLKVKGLGSKSLEYLSLQLG